MRGHSRYLEIAVALLLSSVAGCREELGPERFVTTQVSGTILVGGRPIDNGWIEFIPVEGTVGKLRSAPIRSDGTFVADRVAVGWNQIGIVNAPISPALAQEFHPMNSSNPLRRKIPAHRSEIEIDLYGEAVRKQKAVPRTP